MTLRSSILAILLLGAWMPCFAVKWTYSTPGSDFFTAVGDVNGDGEGDAIVVDRVSGVVTIGIRATNGTLTFRSPAASGLPNATSLAVGRFTATERDTLMLTSPEANRLLVLDASAPFLRPTKASSSFGALNSNRVPRRIAAIDVASGGSSGFDDVAVLMSEFTPAEVNYSRLGLGNDGTGGFPAPSGFIFPTVSNLIRGWQPVELTRGAAPTHLGYLELATTPVFRLAVPHANPFSWSAASGTGSPGSHTEFVYGQFDGAESDFIFFTPGTIDVRVTRYLGSSMGFRAPTIHTLPEPISQIYRLPRAVTDRVLVVFDSGAAMVFEYLGNDPGLAQFSFIESLDLEGRFGGAAVPMADGSFALMTGTVSSGPLDKFSVYQDDGSGGYVTPQLNQMLPDLSEAPSLNGNVFFFEGVPLIDEGATWLGSLGVGDWSSQLSLSPVPQVQGENFINGSAGLGGAFVEPITPLPGGATGGMANQHLPDISFSNLDPMPVVLGTDSGGLDFDPPPGDYDHAVPLRLAASTGSGTVFFRTASDGAFAAFPTLPPPNDVVWLFDDATVEAYVATAGGRSPIVRGVYTFSAQAGEQDQDGDGVPDFVEVEKGLDPAGGPDSDGDGATDLEELIAGTDPNDGGSTPDLAARADTAAKLLLTVTPRPWDGVGDQASFAAQGVEVQCHDVSGGLLGAGLTDQPVGMPAASFASDPFESEQRLLVVSTPAHFPIATANANKRIGREMIGLIPAPNPGRKVWETSEIDDVDLSGQYASLKISPVTGRPVVAFVRANTENGFNQSLHLAEFDGSQWSVSQVDGDLATSGNGAYCSLAFTPSGDPAISYLEGTPNNNLRYARRTAGVWSIETVDSSPNVGWHTSLVMLPSGQPAIAYQQFSSRDVKYAFFDGAAWQSWTAAATGSVGSENSMAVDPISGTPAIFSHQLDFASEVEERLEFLEIAGVNALWNRQTVDDNLLDPLQAVGRQPSLVYHPVTNHPTVSYGGSTLRFAQWNGASWQLETVAPDAGDTSLAYDPNTQQPVIAYYDRVADDLVVTRLDGSAWNAEIIDSDGDVGGVVSLAFSSDGLPHIAYHDTTNGALKYATMKTAPTPENLGFIFDASETQAVETARWIAEATAASAVAGPQTMTTELGVDDVLAFVMVEGRLANMFFLRGIGGSVDPVILTPFRPSEPPEPFAFTVTQEQLLSLETVPPGLPPDFTDAILIRDLHAHVQDLFQAPPGSNPDVDRFKQLGREIYRISSALHDADPSAYRSPIAVLRDLIRFGFLDPAYNAQVVGLTGGDISAVGSFLFNFAFNGDVRPKLTVDLVQNGAPSVDGRTYAQRPVSGLQYELLDREGRPFELPEAFDLPPGTAFRVTAFDDIAPGAIPHPIEVIAIQLTSVPRPSVSDQDGNLLPDEWEGLFFGSSGADPLSSPDGSGFSLLQQFLEGTDPTIPTSVPSVLPVNFAFGPVEGDLPVEDEFTIDFSWPQAYSEAFGFVVEGSSDLVTFMEVPATFVDLGAGEYQASITLPSGTQLRFFRVAIRLR